MTDQETAHELGRYFANESQRMLETMVTYNPSQVADDAVATTAAQAYATLALYWQNASR